MKKEKLLDYYPELWGDTRACPKCDTDGDLCIYRTHRIRGLPGTKFRHIKHEFLKLKCTKCGYVEGMYCKDWKKKTSEKPTQEELLKEFNMIGGMAFDHASDAYKPQVREVCRQIREIIIRCNS